MLRSVMLCCNVLCLSYQILLYNFIEHIHIKDKNNRKQNVKLTTGLVNFSKFFKILKQMKYKKNFTFETTRGDDPIKTAKNNINFLRKGLNLR